MAASAIAAAAAPPLLPTPPKTSLPALLPTSPKTSLPALLPTPPSICRLVSSPASPTQSIRRFAPSPTPPAPYASKKPGRASASESWVRDKAARAGLAPSSSLERTQGFKIPGRASLSESWVRDKLAATAPADVPANSGCGKRSLTPSAYNIGKKQRRYESPSPLSEDSGSDSSDSEPEFYAGPAFLNAPHPSSLPIPCFVRAR